MDIESVRTAVATFDIPLAGDVLLNPRVENGVMIAVYITRDAHGRQSPSPKTLEAVRSALAQLGASSDFVLLDESAQQLEDSVKASLVKSYPHLIANSFVTVEDGVAQVWIDKKVELSEADRQALAGHVRAHAELFSLKGAILHVMSDASIATPIEVLRVVRKLAPATCEEVCTELESRGFAVPSLQWVNFRFDLLRKQHLLVRMADRRYALSKLALEQLGTIKSGRSPDVDRFLALARRGA